MKEIRVGDEWISVSQQFANYFQRWVYRFLNAEEKEKRIWRPLETAIGTRDFMEVEK